MKIKSSLKSIKKRDLNSKLVRRRGRVYVINKTNPLFSKKIVMTKVRSKEIIEKLPIFGAELENNISKNTFALITKSKEEKSNKIIKAREMNIPIFTPEEFIEKYLK